jgi:DNA (cytosine-5)-methyltransferase 1
VPLCFFPGVSFVAENLTFGSLFAGIGGFDLGLERAGMICKWQVEIDEYCQKVLAKHWPDVQRYGDIQKVFALRKVDLICGGFPCQDISYAGKGAGIEGARSGLWSEYARIIRLVRPRYVLVENVPALLGRGIGVVLGDLAESGYDAEWDCIPAAAVGAPHRRERVWIVAHTDNAGPQRRDSPILSERASKWTSGQGRPSRILAYSEGKRGSDQDARQFWIAEPDVGRVAHGVPRRVDRLKALGNAVVPQVAEWIGRRILERDLTVH